MNRSGEIGMKAEACYIHIDWLLQFGYYFYSSGKLMEGCLMFFVLYDAWVLCLCLYGEGDTLIFPIDRAAVTFADQTLVEINLMRLMTGLHDK